MNILLTADLDELAARVREYDRPRVNPGTTLEEDLSRIWGDHEDLYYSFADIVHHTRDHTTISRDAEELLETLRREYPSLMA